VICISGDNSDGRGAALLGVANLAESVADGHVAGADAALDDLIDYGNLDVVV
jgi:hypothetical protein